MTTPIPEEAVTAAAEALGCAYGGTGCDCQACDNARAALAAAEKPWCEHIAQEIRERIDTDQKRLTNYSLGWNAGMENAARIVQGGGTQ